MMKLVIGTSLALATMAASPSFAATYNQRDARAAIVTDEYVVAPGTDAFAAAPGYAYGGSPAVIVDGQVIGADPDPNVRLNLLRDANSQDGY